MRRRRLTSTNPDPNPSHNPHPNTNPSTNHNPNTNTSTSTNPNPYPNPNHNSNPIPNPNPEGAASAADADGEARNAARPCGFGMTELLLGPSKAGSQPWLTVVPSLTPLGELVLPGVYLGEFTITDYCDLGDSRSLITMISATYDH